MYGGNGDSLWDTEQCSAGMMPVWDTEQCRAGMVPACGILSSVWREWYQPVGY